MTSDRLIDRIRAGEWYSTDSRDSLIAEFDIIEADNKLLQNKLTDCGIQIRMLCNAKDGYFKLWGGQFDRIKELESEVDQSMRELQGYLATIHMLTDNLEKSKASESRLSRVEELLKNCKEFKTNIIYIYELEKALRDNNGV